MGKHNDIVCSRIPAASADGAGPHAVRGGKGVDDQGLARLVHHLKHADSQAAPKLPVPAEVRDQFLSDVDLRGHQELHSLGFPDIRRRVGRAHGCNDAVMKRGRSLALAGDQGHVSARPLEPVFQRACRAVPDGGSVLREGFLQKAPAEIRKAQAVVKEIDVPGNDAKPHYSAGKWILRIEHAARRYVPVGHVE